MADKPLSRIVQKLNETLEVAGVGADEVEIVCLTGGTSRMPIGESAVRERLPRAQVRRLASFHSVVEGLSRHAQTLL